MFSSQGLSFDFFSLFFCSFMVVLGLELGDWGLGLGFLGLKSLINGVWALWCVAFCFFGIKAFYINIEE